ncbi:MAG: MobF family relaxase [Acidimicrobiales bacterium]|jgi:conjugative relaxase-like TrwC/TraI family protein
MILSVTVLGSNDGTPLSVIGQRIVEYLEGGRLVAGGRRPGTLVELPSPEGGTVAYYADSAGLRPGCWVLGRSGEVDPAELARLLAGVDPAIGEPLLSARGSSGRAERCRRLALAPTRLDKEWYSTKEAASVLGITPSYLRRLLRARVRASDDDADGIKIDSSGAWQINKDAVVRISEHREPPKVVAGYDLTFSVPKSVSVLWAGGDDRTRAATLEALDEAVAGGLRYLERQAFKVSVGKRPLPASGILAADYLHTTSRALEPQLHHHVVVANYGVGTDGVARALDARFVFHHAKTASFLAAAELRHQLTARLGVTWTQVENGIAEIEGVPAAALEEMSSRAREITEATGALGVSSARARQVAAWDTRAAKEHGVELDALFASWDERLTIAGYGPEARGNVFDRVDGPGLFTAEERVRRFRELLRSDGLTEHEAVFDRRHVVQRLAELSGDRLSADAIDALADEVITQPDLVELKATRDTSAKRSIRRTDGRVVKLPGERIYSTTSMLALEHRALAAYERGREAGAGIVPAERTQQVLGTERFARLSEEQRRFVESLTSSGMRVQAGVGAAGSGKTTALEATVACWQAEGYRVLGAAVGGTQAVVLSEETGVEGRTVASVLARYFDRGDFASIDARTVLLVDEASLVSTRDFVALARATEETGAILRLVGDPAQHSAVAAGGMFRYLTEHHPDDTATLSHLYRQQGEEMAEVRLANAEYREGKITEALERLRRDGRITEAESADEAYDLLTCAWYAERQKRVVEPERHWSAMTAEHHFERRELNVRARALLADDGTLKGPELTVAGLSFRSGDEVIARITDRSLRAEGAARNAYVRNGSLGTVVEVHEHGGVVDFERWGRVAIPLSYLERKVSAGIVGGLQHAYALTSHAAQGKTFAVAAPLVTDASSLEGVYVGITRGQFDLQAVAIRRRDLSQSLTDDALPVLRDETSALVETERRLRANGPELLASELAATRRRRVRQPHAAPPINKLTAVGNAVVAGEPSKMELSAWVSQASPRSESEPLDYLSMSDSDRAIVGSSAAVMKP